MAEAQGGNAMASQGGGAMEAFAKFEELGTRIAAVVEDQKALIAHVQRVETTMATCITKDDLDKSTAVTMDKLAKQERLLERLDMMHKSMEYLNTEVPEMKVALSSRMTDLEKRLHAEIGNTVSSMGGRLGKAESKLREKASKADVVAMGREVEELVRKAEGATLQDDVNGTRDAACDRIDVIGEKLYEARRELSKRVDAMAEVQDELVKRVDGRTQKLESQSSRVSSFLLKAQRMINSKVGSRHLTCVPSCTPARLAACLPVCTPAGA